jgi:DNA mismatch endonuclease (patch repair protein)
MQAVKSKDTAPELTVRRMAHGMGYRFRVHRKDLPGNPDIVFPRLHKLIFVNGCFWHGHDCARGARVPKGNRDYWLNKIGRNRSRDQQNLERLTAAGWRSLVIWECSMTNEKELRAQVRDFLIS